MSIIDLEESNQEESTGSCYKYSLLSNKGSFFIIRQDYFSVFSESLVNDHICFKDDIVSDLERDLEIVKLKYSDALKLVRNRASFISAADKSEKNSRLGSFAEPRVDNNEAEYWKKELEGTLEIIDKMKENNELVEQDFKKQLSENQVIMEDALNDLMQTKQVLELKEVEISKLSNKIGEISSINNILKEEISDLKNQLRKKDLIEYDKILAEEKCKRFTKTIEELEEKIKQNDSENKLRKSKTDNSNLNPTSNARHNTIARSSTVSKKSIINQQYGSNDNIALEIESETKVRSKRVAFPQLTEPKKRRKSSENVCTMNLTEALLDTSMINEKSFFDKDEEEVRDKAINSKEQRKNRSILITGAEKQRKNKSIIFTGMPPTIDEKLELIGESIANREFRKITMQGDIDQAKSVEDEYSNLMKSTNYSSQEMHQPIFKLHICSSEVLCFLPKVMKNAEKRLSVLKELQSSSNKSRASLYDNSISNAQADSMKLMVDQLQHNLLEIKNENLQKLMEYENRILSLESELLRSKNKLGKLQNKSKT